MRKALRRQRLTDAYMLVLLWVSRHPLAFPDEIAAGLGLPLAVVQPLVADLQAAGMIDRAPKQ